MKRAIRFGILATLLCGIGIVVSAAMREQGTFGARYIDIDLNRPDALVSSEHLARMPADILKLPMLREVLSEDFVFYYAQNETRLSAEGALRRIAFEHDMTLGDHFLSNLLDEPADLALWRAPNGSLRYWVLSIRRNTLARLTDTLAKLALRDSQLRIAGELNVEGKQVKVFALHLNDKRTLLFASHGDRTLVISDAGMLFGDRTPDNTPLPSSPAEKQHGLEIAAPDKLTQLIPERAERLAALLAGKNGAAFLSKRFQLPDQPVKGHRAALAAHFLSFGYQAFFPGIEAMRFDFDGTQWSSQLLAAGMTNAGDRTALWQAMPGQGAACVSLPVNWTTLEPAVGASLSPADKSTLRDALQGPLGMCWYAKSQLNAPLFVAQFKSDDAARRAAPLLLKLFESSIGAFEPDQEGGRFPVESRKTGNATVLSRIVSSPFGTDKKNGNDKLKAVSGPRYFPVSLALSGRWAAFSPDARLAEDALAVSNKRFPAAADGLGNAGSTVLRIVPARLAQLLQTEANAALPRDKEPVFSGVVRTQLTPRLQALRRHPAFVATLPVEPTATLAWVPLNWSYEAK
ncbi:DUF2138 family protein [Viridibacterium curvum]|uniref:DUF2138 domain-containing protein n=1 Tax=Viridibacterium curvum TaxID=1101404 RepID=A0ABP9QVA8_9RHOO